MALAFENFVTSVRSIFEWMTHRAPRTSPYDEAAVIPENLRPQEVNQTTANKATASDLTQPAQTIEMSKAFEVAPAAPFLPAPVIKAPKTEVQAPIIHPPRKRGILKGGNKEVEVSRKSPKPGHFYFTCTYTRREGRYPNERYWTTNPLIYCGKHVRIVREGYGDGATIYEIFDLDGAVNRVDYTYEGTTCYVEVTEQEKNFGSFDLIMKIRNYLEYAGQPKIIMEDLIKEVYSPKRTMYALQFHEDLEDYLLSV